MDDITYRLTVGLAERLRLAEDIFRLIEPDYGLFHGATKTLPRARIRGIVIKNWRRAKRMVQQNNDNSLKGPRRPQTNTLVTGRERSRKRRILVDLIYLFSSGVYQDI